MDGYLVTFFTQQSREHNGTSVADWLLGQARELGVRGATLFSGQEGFGHDGRFHSENLFDLEDPPLQVVIALTPAESDQLFSRIEENGLCIFYTKSRVEFGFTSDG
jgi:PII-like signaling protein